MARRLRNLKIDDVSSVDVGAGRGVRVVLHKRDSSQLVMRKHKDGTSHLYGKPITFGDDVPAEALAYLKHEFTQEERDSKAKTGHALPDGSFPIDNKSDLGNAIHAIGRAKNPGRAKAHIKTRARALGAEDMLPDGWSKRDVGTARKSKVAGVVGLVNKAIVEGIRKNAVDFSEAIVAADNVDDASDLMCDVRDAVYALDCSINSILSDNDVADKAASIAESYGQFKAYIGGLSLEDDGDDDDDNVEKTEMTSVTDLNPAIKKVLEDAIAKAVGGKDAEIAKLAHQVAYLKMKKEHQAYHDGLGSDEAKRKFTDMSDEDREDEMNKTRKRAEDDPIYKAMRVKNEELQKRLEKIEDERALEIAKRDAKEMGLTQNDAGEVLMKMRRGDTAAIKTYEGYMVALAKAQNAQVRTGKLFDEFGTGRGNDGTTGEGAQALLKAKADEVRKANPALTEAQAFEKAYLDPANRELMEQERRERFLKLGARMAS